MQAKPKDKYTYGTSYGSNNGNEQIRNQIINVLNTLNTLKTEVKRCIAGLEKQGEKEITWDKEDEENVNNILYILNQLKDTSDYKEDDVVEKTINWLKSIKYRLYQNNEYDKDYDEKLRKTTIAFLKEYADKGYENAVECISWLEKQGEDKDDVEPKDYTAIDPHFGRPIDKAKPKFDVGQWVVYNRNDNSREIIQVYDIRDGRYYFTDNVHFSWSVKECDEKSHLWTIKDARPGDILAYDDTEHIMLVKESHDSTYGWRLSCRCHLLDGGNFEAVEYHVKTEGLHPATNHQRDVFMKAMNDAGYTFDFNNLKKLKNYESNSKESFK